MDIVFREGDYPWDSGGKHVSNSCYNPTGYKNLSRMIPVGEKTIDGWTKVAEFMIGNGESMVLWSSPESHEPNLSACSYNISIQKRSSSGDMDYCDSFVLLQFNAGTNEDRCTYAKECIGKLMVGDTEGMEMIDLVTV